MWQEWRCMASTAPGPISTRSWIPVPFGYSGGRDKKGRPVRAAPFWPMVAQARHRPPLTARSLASMHLPTATRTRSSRTRLPISQQALVDKPRSWAPRAPRGKGRSAEPFNRRWPRGEDRAWALLVFCCDESRDRLGRSVASGPKPGCHARRAVRGCWPERMIDVYWDWTQSVLAEVSYGFAPGSSTVQSLCG